MVFQGVMSQPVDVQNVSMYPSRSCLSRHRLVALQLQGKSVMAAKARQAGAVTSRCTTRAEGIVSEAHLVAVMHTGTTCDCARIPATCVYHSSIE